MTEAAVSFAGNLTDQPEVHYTEGGIARAMFRVADLGPPGAGGVVLHRGRVARPGLARRAVPGQGQPGGGRGSAPAAELDRRGWQRRSAVEVVAEELGSSLRWATAITTRATRSSSQ